MYTDQLFKLVKQPDSKLFFCSKDPNDIRLGTIVKTEQDAYINARFVIVSCSQDIGVKRNFGRCGTDRAPDVIRESFYRLTVPTGLKTGDLFDIGDTCIDASLEEIHARHFEVVRQLIRDNKCVIVLGGGNDLSYPDGKAFQSGYPNFSAVNVDAHLDIRQNEHPNSGTPYRQLIEENIVQPQAFFEVGIQQHANSSVYLKQASDWKVNLIPLEELTEFTVSDGLKKAFQSHTCEALMLNFDMDAVKAADAPGVSASLPTGLTAEQAQNLVRYFTLNFPVKMFEITEVNPKFDIDNRTAKLAAILMFTFLRYYPIS